MLKKTPGKTKKQKTTPGVCLETRSKDRVGNNYPKPDLVLEGALGLQPKSVFVGWTQLVEYKTAISL